jgi:uncharacterized membrane protein
VTAPRTATFGAERRIGRLLIALAYVSVALLVGGVVLMLVGGISPLDGGPPLHLDVLFSNLASLDPAGFLWLGLLAVIATPFSQVALAGYAYARERDWAMVRIAIGIFVIIAVGIGAAVTGTV